MQEVADTDDVEAFRFRAPGLTVPLLGIDTQALLLRPVLLFFQGDVGNVPKMYLQAALREQLLPKELNEWKEFVENMNYKP